MIYKYTAICSLGYSVTAFVATIGTRCGKYTPVANNCGNVLVRFSTFFILENVGKIKKTLKNVKKRFFTSMFKAAMVVVHPI